MPSAQSFPPLDIPKSVRIQSPQATLARCRELITAGIAGAYQRFGDGDIFLWQGRDDGYQRATPELSLEMARTLELGGPGVMKCLPIHCPRFGIWPGMAPRLHEAEESFAVELLRAAYPYFIGTPIYSPQALSYLAAFEPPLALDFLRFLRSVEPALLVGNGDIPPEMVSKLFAGAVHIKTPPRDSYLDIARIEAESVALLTAQAKPFTVVVTAMGCAGRPLATRLLTHGLPIFVFDFGSLIDALCGWTTRGWMRLGLADVSPLRAAL